MGLHQLSNEFHRWSDSGSTVKFFILHLCILFNELKFKKMKNSICLLFFAVIIAVGCGDDEPKVQLTTPATYTLSSLATTSVNAFRWENGEFVEISIAEAGNPEIASTNNRFDLLMLDNASQLQFNDGFETYTVDYEVDGDRLEFVGGGSRYSLQISDDGRQLSFLRISGGPYNENTPNGWVSASCDDVDCNNINYDEWLFDANEGEVFYVLVLEESYVRM